MMTASERLLKVGTELFAQEGFDAVSVREICAKAKTSSTMIHHYFGSKQGLLDAILDQFSTETFSTPLRLIEEVPKDKTAFVCKIELFINETFEALITQKYVIKILSNQETDFVVFRDFVKKFTHFIEEAKEKGFVRKSVEADMLAGLILDRLGNQVMYSVMRKNKKGPDAISDKVYRKKWLKANTAIILNGII